MVLTLNVCHTQYIDRKVKAKKNMNHGDTDQIEFDTNVFGKYYEGLPKLPKANYSDKLISKLFTFIYTVDAVY